MKNTDISADRAVNALYAGLRGRYGERSSRANGYVYEGYFRREQKIVFSLLDEEATVLVDVACGSGLMVEPLLNHRKQIIGLDFNADACAAARDNGLRIIRGDAFCLPLADACVDEIITCQFFNQQQPDAVRTFIKEGERILRPGGRLVMVWRNGSAWVHRLALACFGTLDRLRGLPRFPYENHSLNSTRKYAEDSNLVVAVQMVAFPPLSWTSNAVESWCARLIGASNICVLEKPKFAND